MVTANHPVETDPLWADRGERKPRMGLSLGRIATAAIAVADTDGIEAVSMQRVAEDLGFTKMSLYRHVSNKAELVSVMIDMAVGEPPDLAAIRDGWRSRLEEFVRQLTGVWRQHPWIPDVTVGGRTMGPREVGWIESALSAFAGTPLTGDERLAAVFQLFGHIRNTHSTATAGTQPWMGDANVVARLRRRSDAFPELIAALAADGTALRDNGRAFGLDRLYEGFAALISERS
ncbi:TetR/AcrR family transcriptional regulator [Virgisporangium aurantiacum]|uniref:TetR family transcriptional regulator n=1 Tax=Virgisporangium aurantiacum TaxID=175570 RepID=A0A8J3ZF99_9ACTN|nr:TetR/AcrR family transcriptional regulator [Virgisporangium aurantiacum]GIJ63032.1 TetR family transcriptional regulator [Virgisporangium aurantiacum]